MEPVPEEEEEEVERSDERKRPTYRRAEEEEAESKGASGSADRYESPAPREGADRPLSPPWTAVPEEEEAAADRAEPEEEAAAAEADEEVADAPPVLVMDRDGIPALLPPEGQNLVPGTRVN